MPIFLYEKLLFEGVETKNMSAAKHFLRDKYDYDDSSALNYIGAIKRMLPNSRVAKCKFMQGIVRMITAGELEDELIRFEVNRALEFAGSDEYKDKFDKNLNGISAEEFIKEMNSVIKKDIEKKKAKIAKLNLTKNSDYEVYRMNSFEDASKFSKYTSWCICHSFESFRVYSCEGLGEIFIIVRKDYKDIPEEKGEGYPLDNYGKSMIEVSLYPDGSCNTIVSRWNRVEDAGLAGSSDNIMNEVELSEIIGVDFFKVFKLDTNNQKKKIDYSEFVEKAKEYIESNEITVLDKDTGSETRDNIKRQAYRVYKYDLRDKNYVKSDIYYDVVYAKALGLEEKYGKDIAAILDNKGNLKKICIFPDFWGWDLDGEPYFSNCSSDFKIFRISDDKVVFNHLKYCYSGALPIFSNFIYLKEIDNKENILIYTKPDGKNLGEAIYFNDGIKSYSITKKDNEYLFSDYKGDVLAKSDEKIFVCNNPYIFIGNICYLYYERKLYPCFKIDKNLIDINKINYEKGVRGKMRFCILVNTSKNKFEYYTNKIIGTTPDIVINIPELSTIKPRFKEIDIEKVNELWQKYKSGELKAEIVEK